MCKSTLGCTHYAYSYKNNGICQMRKGRVTKSDAFPSSHNDFCGIINDTRPMFQSGRSSRWDCCKVVYNFYLRISMIITRIL